MNSEFKNKLPGLVETITNNYQTSEFFFVKENTPFPDRQKIIEIIKDVRRLMFPGYFGNEHQNIYDPSYFVGHMLIHIEDELYKQVLAALAYSNDGSSSKEEIKELAQKDTVSFMEELPNIQQILISDVQAAYDGDPAANNKEEIIFSYPGMLAIFVYRIAHVLHELKVPYIPRIMTEYAHSRSGIDINAGAKIGNNFFMDHGTGIVIGETTEIGNNVKIYQGVTLGALSTKQGHLLNGVKRHPTIEDDVTIYSNASILGGDTVIGRGAVIGGSAFVVSSVKAGEKVLGACEK
ncbi:MAG: serine O-acetyltransferase [Lachnospiraceae bacterium]|nr:serine O-acetyltransferase [Lachnospiraceae bacterium]